jgi:hypothetical protein
MKITHRCGSDTLDDTRATPWPKMPPSGAVNAYGVSQHVVQPSSLDPSLVIAIDITGRERRTTGTQLDQWGKTYVTKALQDRPVNMAINSWLLDMQDIKVWWAKTSD